MKNRYDGTLGKFQLKFNKESLSFSTVNYDFNDDLISSDRSRVVGIDDEMFEDIKKNLTNESIYGPFSSKPHGLI